MGDEALKHILGDWDQVRLYVIGNNHHVPCSRQAARLRRRRRDTWFVDSHAHLAFDREF
jgi:hypothetical protein